MKYELSDPNHAYTLPCSFKAQKGSKDNVKNSHVTTVVSPLML